MGMPSVNISFTEKAVQSVQRSDRGIVAMILKDAVPEQNPVTVFNTTDIPSKLTAENKYQIALALMGYVKAPRKIIVYVLPEDAPDYNEALNYLETERFDYLVIPSVETDGMTSAIVSWIKTQRQNDKKCKAVLPNTKADTEGIVNVTTEEFLVGETVYTAEQYCARIAGLIAGTPLTISCTYAPLNELTDCTRLTRAQMDAAVDAGEFIVFNDGEKVKVGRGVNSLTTTTAEKGNQFKKIKIVEAMDMIFDDIKKTAEDSYLGKFANNYDNKCLLISAIGGYFEQLTLDGIISQYSIGIDIAAQKALLKSIGEDVENMSDDEIKTADTQDKVFLNATVKILDAIEEINLPITI
ncbi:phage tail sheath subtilisin-like domain-containing protein [Anaerocolumna aminovalerica]|uniref:phage tail sheath subtilisin-like domain-containing protein n=1 Tax=Anaerocolumna aminovalerica TaxID=1527 RepID=UPI001C0ED08B|nr:phage tail sheath subtilisin-like domain-containing protein [Anaerocolumna aminovalerica]MBU5331414.1 phage tail sheath subtilisin-like domain-containing protein [Anaerocolumna aminovalerica]